MPNGIEGYNIYFNDKLKHHNYSGIFVNNEEAESHIQDGESPLMEDAYQWIEANYGYVGGGFSDDSVIDKQDIELKSQEDIDFIDYEFFRFLYVIDNKYNRKNHNLIEFEFNDDFSEIDSVVELFENISQALFEKLKINEISEIELYNLVLIFCYFKLDKLTKSKDSNLKVAKDDLYCSFNKIEKNNFMFILDVVFQFIWYFKNENQNDIEYNDLKLDFINITNLIKQKKAIKFKDKIKGFNLKNVFK